jgi:hypothetical protein
MKRLNPANSISSPINTCHHLYTQANQIKFQTINHVRSFACTHGSFARVVSELETSNQMPLNITSHDFVLVWIGEIGEQMRPAHGFVRLSGSECDIFPPDSGGVKPI